MADESGLTHYQISFIVGRYGHGKLFQHDFLATPEEVAAFQQSLDGALREHVQDLQMYPPLDSSSQCTAAGTASDILSAAGIDEASIDLEADIESIAALDALAGQIDGLATDNLATEPWCVEFVWSAGGGDDNAFSQCFPGPVDHEDLRQDYIAYLDALLGSMVRDITVRRGTPQPEGDISEALEAVLECLERSKLGNAAMELRYAWAGRVPSAGMTR
jgi:hypothetical protein